MASKVHKNTFEGGMNKDIDPQKLPANVMTDAFDISLSESDAYGSPSQSRGGSLLATVLSNTEITDHDDIHIMGLYEARLKTAASTYSNAIVIFLYNDKAAEKFEVQFYDIDNDTLYDDVYTDSFDRLDNKTTVDAVVFREADVDYIYFTDYETPPKKLPVDVTSQSSYVEEEISLRRRSTRGYVSVNAVADGGDLVCGAYQFAIRLLNPTKNKSTAWSTLTNPVMVGADFGTDEKSFGGVGTPTNKKITLDVSTVEDFTSYYTHYQIAIIEDINGNATAPTSVKLAEPAALFASSSTFDYTSNIVQDDIITIDELTVEDAAIAALRSLAIKHNRLIGGGIKYSPLDYDNNDPIVAASSTPAITELTGTDAYADYTNASSKVGYFRDELYRFAISYFDEFGNFSKPKVLDLSAITDNKSSSGIDMRFPDRDNGLYGTPLRDNTGIKIRELYLKLQGIKNHPTWAKGFVILRAPRKKKILFQTPLVPSILVQPAEAKGDYPDQRKDQNNAYLDVLNVEAANPDGAYVPKNFFHVVPKSLINQSELVDLDAATGGVFYINTAGRSLAMYSSDQTNYYLMQQSSSVRRGILYSSLPASDTLTVYEDIIGTSISTTDVKLVVYRELIATSGWPTRDASNPWYEPTPPYQSAALSAFAPDTYKYLIETTLL